MVRKEDDVIVVVLAIAVEDAKYFTMVVFNFRAKVKHKLAVSISDSRQACSNHDMLSLVVFSSIIQCLA